MSIKEQFDIKYLRSQLDLTQNEFAAYFGIPVKTVRNWEQGLNTPPQYVPLMIQRIINSEKELQELKANA